MKKIIVVASVVLVMLSCKNQGQDKMVSTDDAKQNDTIMERETIYQFKVKDISGSDFDFASLKGKKIMIVNTASKCGLTPQYEQLQELYTSYKDHDFVIVAFPANNFSGQEPGTNEEIATFCETNFNITFPIMSKISVKGDDMNPVYQFLTQKSRNGLVDSEVSWNFQKYLINKNGELVKVINPNTIPLDDVIVNWIRE